LLDVPEIKSQFSGREGFEKHFEEMLGNQTGEIYNPGKTSFHLRVACLRMFFFQVLHTLRLSSAVLFRECMHSTVIGSGMIVCIEDVFYFIITLFLRGEYGKVGMFCISGEPNKGKTALGKTALSLSSNTQFLFSYKVSFLFICPCILTDSFKEG
jgi:hypothetical protein